MSVRSIAILLSLPYFIFPQWSVWYAPLIFWIGILLVGIPHGAVDHHIQLKEKATNRKKLTAFIIKYISLMVLFFLFWVITPTLSIVLFVLISAYHFGMVDFGHPIKLLKKITSTLYGLLLLGTIIFSDKESVSPILELLSVNTEIIEWYSNAPSYTSYFLLAALAFIVFIEREHKLWWTFALLLMGTEMPLLLSFGLYFSFQHALESTIEIRNHLSTSIFKLIRYAFPFSLGAYIIGTIVFVLISIGDLSIASILPFTFLFLGMVTLPHVVYYSFDE